MAAGDELSELEALAALADVGGDTPPAPEQSVVAVAADLGAPDDEDLMAVVAIAEQQPAPRRFEQRGAALMAYCRAKKLAKAAGERAERAEALVSRQASQLQLMAAQHPQSAKLIGLPKAKGQMDVPRAMLVIKLAMMPTLRGNVGAFRKAQDKAAALVARVARRLQLQCVDDMLRVTPESAGSQFPSMRLVAVVWQWDETSQRVKGMIAQCLPGETCGLMQMSVQVMMQSGVAATCVVSPDGARATRAEPLICRGRTLEAQTADGILAAMFKEHPIHFECPERLRPQLAAVDFLLVGFVCDRASANFSALQYIWHQLRASSDLGGILPFVHPCTAHGIALAKGRLTQGKRLVATTHTLAALMRQWRFSLKMRDECLRQCDMRLQVRHEPRPRHVVEQSRALVKLLLGDESTAFLQRRGQDGALEPSALLADVQHLSDLVDLGAAADSRWIHWRLGRRRYAWRLRRCILR